MRTPTAAPRDRFHEVAGVRTSGWMISGAQPAVPPHVLIALAAIAALLAAIVPMSRSDSGFTAWWSAGPLSALAGVVVTVATLLLAAASLASGMRRLGLLGASLALLAAALWALGAAPHHGLALVVVAVLSLAGCVAQLAAPRRSGAMQGASVPAPSVTAATAPEALIRTRDFSAWMVTGGLVLALVASLALTIDRLGSPITPMPSLPILITAIVTGVMTMLAGVRRRRNLRDGVTVVLALVGGTGLVVLSVVQPLLEGDRAGAALAARVAMLAVTAVISIVPLLPPAALRASRSIRSMTLREPHHGNR